MGKVMMGRLALVPALAGVLCGCQQEKVYQLSPTAAEAALVGSRIPAIAFGMAAHCGPGVEIPGGVAWHISHRTAAPQGHQEFVVLTAKFSPSGDGTQVAVDVEPSATANKDAFAKGMAEKPAVANMFRAIVSEQVDAALSKRDFEFANIRGSMALAMVSMMPEIRQQMDRQTDDYQRAERQKVDDAYRTAGPGSGVPSGYGTQTAPSNPWK